MNILGISRAAQFSPNAVDRDEAIFHAVEERLRKAGHSVRRVEETHFTSTLLNETDCVFSMSRLHNVLKILKTFEMEGKRIINSPSSLLAYNRGKMFLRFYYHGLWVPYVRTVTPQSEVLTEDTSFPLWIKRNENSMYSEDDIAFITTPDQLVPSLKQFFERGLKEALLCEHIEGEKYKCYGVLGTGFFYVSPGCPIPASRLQEEMEKAAKLAVITVYGGDCVVCPDSTFYIIDFNDWPSFALCREQAADAIVRLIIENHEQ